MTEFLQPNTSRSEPTPQEGALAPLDLAGWKHLYSGKVRDLYAPDLAGEHPLGDVVLVVASDRISAYDHVLDTPIPDKGLVLTQLSLWWFDQLKDLVDNHVVSSDPSLLPGDGLVPEEVWGRAMICRRLDMFPVECVARGYLTGSGLTEYDATGHVCGVPLPEGLVDGSQLPEPIFTPATKADIGDHDINVNFDAVVDEVGVETAAHLRALTLKVYTKAAEIAAERGIILADTKFEFGLDPASGSVMVGDEVLTPDSSRFWPADEWEPGHSQPSFDKQQVRDWLVSDASGWDRRTPPPALPDDVVAAARGRYLEAYQRLVGEPLGI